MALPKLKKAAQAEDFFTDIPREPRLRVVIETLRKGFPVSDFAFDQIYPEWVRQLSLVHWTPVGVAARAARLLCEGFEKPRVLDVGSGVGKFCIVGSLTTHGHFTGIEQREHFVRVGKLVVNQYQITRTRFISGNFENLDWSAFNGVYLFNPFQENLFDSPVLDTTVRTHPDLFARYVAATRQKLHNLNPGSRVVTYWGFGDSPPDSYQLEVREETERGFLECWIKV